MTPTVSVVVTCYNFGRYVGTALESIRTQTFEDYEVIVVDDGSTDESLAVIGRYLDDDRFRLIRQRHGGQARAKNRGLTDAKGQFIAFLDADDYWLPHKLARQIPRFVDPRIGVVHTRRKLIDADGRRLELPTAARVEPVGPALNALFRQNFICFSSAMLRRTVVEHVGLFDERIDLGIDYDFWLRVARWYEFDCVDEALTAYRIGHANLSRRQLERLHSARAIMQRFRRHYGGDATLTRDAVARAEAETRHHLGVISRGFSRSAALGWELQSLAARPTYWPAWRGLLATLAPAPIRRLARWLAGRSGAWEQHCFTDSNRPEPIL